MALMFQTLYSLPIIISAVLLLLARPPGDAWRVRYVAPAVVATAVAPLGLVFWFAASKPLVSFTVTDANGKPLADVALRRSFNSPPTAVTDQMGVVRERVPHRDALSCVFTADGYQEHHVTIQRGGADGETFYVYHSWLERKARTERMSKTITETGKEQMHYPSQQPITIPIIMMERSTNEA